MDLIRPFLGSLSFPPRRRTDPFLDFFRTEQVDLGSSADVKKRFFFCRHVSRVHHAFSEHIFLQSGFLGQQEPRP